VQGEQLARQEGVASKPVSLPKVRFTELVADPFRAFALLVLEGKTLWFQPDSNTLVEVSYRAPYYKIVYYREGASHLEIYFTHDTEEILRILREHVAYLADYLAE
jgi:hypothetical protein